ncbi:MAG: hypothetical protein RXR43_11420 [Sulfolobus sp.]
MISHADVGGSDCGDVGPRALGSHDPPKRWLRAKSLHSIMNESVGTNGITMKSK